MIDSIISGKFTLKDMENQLNMMNKMGPMQQIMKLIPGIGSQLPANASKVTEEST